MTNLSGRTILPVLVWVSGYLSCASVGKTEYGKREDKIFMLLPGSQCLDMLCCCCTLSTNFNGKIRSTIQTPNITEQGTKGLA